MLDNKSLLVLTYLKNHFAQSGQAVQSVEIIIEGLSPLDIEESFRILDDKGLITSDDKRYLGRITVTGLSD